ncbi:MAG: 50S ribosomal protein L29 [Nitrospiraceae bacterium]|nr:MAG: 50S ribosomal protein L29 [Nitrospiraceae bacterium]
MKKVTDFKALTIDELKQEENSLRKELFNLRFQRTTGEIENPMRIRHVRKDISRILTIITEKSKAKS